MGSTLATLCLFGLEWLKQRRGAEKETPVIAARGQLRAARGEGHRTDQVRVSLEGLEALAARHVPDDDGPERGRQ